MWLYRAGQPLADTYSGIIYRCCFRPVHPFCNECRSKWCTAYDIPFSIHATGMRWLALQLRRNENMRKKCNGFAVVFFSLYNFPGLCNGRWQGLFRDSEEVPRIESHRVRVARKPYRPGRARAGHAPPTSKSLSVTIIQIQTTLRHSYIAPVLD
jgi:hypothetical protein